jgi:hypothetical protein
MSKEDKPLEYQRRIRDTKGVAQRLDLGYLQRPALILLLRKRAAWLLVIVALAACVPLVLGIGGSRRLVSNGPLSPAHAMFEKRCEVCHTQTLGGVPDKACQGCHDGAAHPAKSMDTAHITAQVRCAECHAEHRGKVKLAAVPDAGCTRCHADLNAHATGVRLAGAKIAAFGAGKHPDFSRAPDTRPIRLNHAIHMPAQARIFRGMKLPMQCGECHAPDKSTPDARFLPVTFEKNCKSCHARELEFDVYHLGVPPAPHVKERQRIHEWVVAQYQALSITAIARRPLGNDLAPQPNAAAWLARVIRDSEAYLFERKCVYCHTGVVGEAFSMVDPVLPRGEFDHRAHRAVACESCHTQARNSTKTSDNLLPAMNSCTPCHSGSSCSTCHQFHNRDLEKNRGRPLQELVGFVRPPLGTEVQP